MTTLEKKQIKDNLSLIKKLINKVIDYNFKHDTHIFIDYSPHVAWVDFRMPNTPDRKWVFGKTTTKVTIYFDCATEEVEVKIKMVESWLDNSCDAMSYENDKYPNVKFRNLTEK